MNDVANDPTDLLDRLEAENDLPEFEIARIGREFIPTIPGAIVHRTLHGENPTLVWREYRGFTIAEMAARAKVSEDAVTYAEAGAPIDRVVLGRLAEAPETTAGEFIPRLWD